MKRSGLILLAAMTATGWAYATAAGVPPDAPADAAAVRPRVWQEQQLVASDAGALQVYGSTVAISGRTALVGAPLANAGGVVNAGVVYVLTESNGVWTEQQRLFASDAVTGGVFGASLAIRGDTAVVGVPGVVYGGSRPAGDAAERGSSTNGAVYVFTAHDGVWRETAKLVADDGEPGDQFGVQLALSDTTLLVGAPFETSDVDRPNQGAAYVFTKSGDSWTQTRKLIAPDARANDLYGWSVALDGTTAAVGAKNATLNRHEPDQGTVYVYDAATWTQTQKLWALDGARSDQFGQSVAISGDTLMVGAYNGGSDVGGHGGVYVYGRTGSSWSQQQKLTSQNGDLFDVFGTTIALSDTTAVIGAPYTMLGGNTQQGAAFVFTRRDGLWQRSQRLAASDGAKYDRIGYYVAYDGATALVSGLVVERAYAFVPHDAATAAVTPTAVQLSLETGTSGTAPLVIANAGGEALDYVLNETTRVALRPRPLAAAPAPGDTIALGAASGSRAVAPWRGEIAGSGLAFAYDDGSYEGTLMLPHGPNEAAAIWLNAFAPAPGTGAFTLDTISIAWPTSASGSLVGRQVNLLAYYDADADGDPLNAVRLGGDHLVTIDALDAFVDYPVNFRVPGDGDIYVGFENTYARGDTWPRLYPGAQDQQSPLGHSWLAGKIVGDVDINDLRANTIVGRIDDFGTPGSWLIRATGTDADNDCVAPADVPWLTLTLAPASGAIAPGGSATLSVAIDTTGLALGRHAALVCVATNDPLARMVRVPVAVTVNPEGVIFRDGFEDAP